MNRLTLMDKPKDNTRTSEGKLLLWTAAFLAVLLPQALHAQPAGPGDWSKVRLFGHAFRNDDYTPEQYDFIRDHFCDLYDRKAACKEYLRRNQH